MKIDIVLVAEILTAASVIVGFIVGIYKFVDTTKRKDEEHSRQIEEIKKNQDEKIKKIQTEQTLLCYCVRAVLDGQHQQGCNGMVTDAINRLDKHLNKAAHDEI